MSEKPYYMSMICAVFRAWWTRVTAALVLVCVVVFVSPKGADAGQCEELVVAGSCGLWPYFFCEPSKEGPSGVFVDMLEAASKKTGISVRYSMYPWKRAFFNLDKGRIDCIAGVFDNAHRRRQYQLSVVVGRKEIHVFVKKGNEFPLQSFADLKGRRGDRQLGSSHGRDFDDYADRHLGMVEVNTVDALVRRVENGYSDYFVAAYDTIAARPDARDILERVTALPFVVYDGKLYFAFSKVSLCTETFKEFDAVFSDLVERGVVKELLARYIAAHSPQ